MKTSFLVMLLIAGVSSGAYAQEAKQRALFNEFYTVSDPVSPSQSDESDEALLNPSSTVEIMWELVEESYALGTRLYSLVRFDHHAATYGQVVEPYNRAKHFGTWIVKDSDKGCLNTRAEVLIRDSQVRVTFNRSGCTVATGKWQDPYSGREYRAASDIQIDHFVPLKNAYISGADKWSGKKRCLYANYQGNKFHLLPVLGKENGRKSDRTPEGYMPLDSSYNCQYLAQWLKVKAIWSLGLTPPEKDAVVNLVQQNHCNASEMSFSESDLKSQRQYIASNMNLCH